VLNYYYYFFIISGVGQSPLGTAATSGLLYKPQMIDEGDCGAIGGMRIKHRDNFTFVLMQVSIFPESAMLITCY
jgi:hypothetical protein